MTKKIRLSKIDLENKVAKSVTEDNKCFWGYIRSKTKTREGIVTLKDNEGKLVSDDMKIANLMNETFHRPLVNVMILSGWRK